MANYSSAMARTSGGTMSRRSYNGLIGLLLAAGFGVLALTSWLALQPAFAGIIESNAMAISIGSLVLTIVGMILIAVGTSKQSVGLMLAGYAIFVVSFGATTSIWLPRYNFNVVTKAFVLTAGISLLFTAVGMLFPSFIEKAAGVAFIALIGIMLASIVMFFFYRQGLAAGGWIDYAMVAIFAIFIGYDTHKAAQIEATVPNAIMSATNIFVDIINLFLHILRILDRD